jgi:hypothetical protein
MLRTMGCMALVDNTSSQFPVLSSQDRFLPGKEISVELSHDVGTVAVVVIHVCDK